MCSLSLCLVSVTLLRMTGAEVLLPLVSQFSRANNPAAPATPAPQPLFRDTFRNNDTGWNLFQGEKAAVALDRNRLTLTVTGPDRDVWATAPRVFDDFRLEIDSGLLDGPSETSYGVIFRHQDDDNYYSFEVDGEGRFRLGKVLRGQYTALIEPSPSVRVQPGQALNHLTVKAVGPQITLGVNGVEVGSFTDRSFASGHIGATASLDGAGTGVVVFGNLEVFRP
ncbi:MAG: DUF1080 domain-containing protein [Anaerolineae bacterium]|nr:DUF1080 domain-containing protein [Anaerolineae bacterium]